ncbi:M23 family metallopeptidase [Gammaproteobacteria bacterium]|nr:M23 family metallopeptidase [Gammaproteobacteria bacterium]
MKILIRVTLLFLLSSCGFSALNNKSSLQEGVSGGVLYSSIFLGTEAYVIKRSGKTSYAIGLPYVLEDKILNINGSDVFVKAKDYGESRIVISNQSYVAPSQLELQRAYDENLLVQKIISQRSKQLNFDLNFIPPVDSIITSAYGKKRFINGELRSPHLATDLRGKEGTPIYAPKNGKVVLVANHFYSGNILILDHGGGLFSSYSHMQKHNVMEGDKIVKGEVIGFVGSTGRVTGPHLHWTIYLNKNRINPELFIELDYL